MTDKFDPADSRHQAIKEDLMLGIALKDIASMGEVDRALEAAGFQVIEAKDRAVAGNDPATPWYRPMEAQGKTVGNALRRIPLGRKVMMASTRLAEALRMSAEGAPRTSWGCWTVPPMPMSREARPGSFRRCTASWLGSLSRRLLTRPAWRFLAGLGGYLAPLPRHAEVQLLAWLQTRVSG